MVQSHPRPAARAIVFMPVVLSGFGAVAGLLMITGSYMFGLPTSEDDPDFFRRVRWFAIAVTVRSATLFVVMVGQLSSPW